MRDVILTDRGPKPIGPYSGHPDEWILVRLGAGGAGPENGGDDGRRHQTADGADAGKREGNCGGGGLELASRGEGDGFSEGHERFWSDERSVCQVFHAVAARAVNGAGGAFAEGCAGGNRS